MIQKATQPITDILLSKIEKLIDLIDPNIEGRDCHYYEISHNGYTLSFGVDYTVTDHVRDDEGFLNEFNLNILQIDTPCLSYLNEWEDYEAVRVSDVENLIE
jgi:hypothetical protein